MSRLIAAINRADDDTRVALAWLLGILIGSAIMLLALPFIILLAVLI